MKKFALFVLVFCCFGATAFAQDLTPIYDHCRKLLLSDTAYATEQSYLLTDEVKYNTDAAGYFKSLTAEGNWKDIDYASKQAAAWMPANHLYRVLLLARAYHKNHDSAYLEAIHRAARFWIKNDILCSNWWQNQINTPFTFSTLMILLDKDAASDELAYLNDVLAKRVQQKNPTGQNLIWQLDNQARIALIHNDYNAFAESTKAMQSVISVSTKEGIQPDHSFHQHGVMLQFGNYGLHFVNSLLFWMTITANTPLAFDKDKQQMLFDYCSEGLRWTVFKGGMDITAIGRQFRENCATKRGDNLYTDFALLKSFDNKDACKYALDGMPGSAGCDLTANKNFWQSDYMVTLAKDKYMMSVKTHGTLVKKLESINGDNMRGSFLNDGVTLIQHTGKEYANIEPLWNWRMLPGTTSDTTNNPEAKETFATSNISDFVGQVSDGKIGVSAMVYNRLGVKANKSYFLVDGMMVALGAGISGKDAANVVTTVNQSIAVGSTQSGKNTAGQRWLWHDSTAYIFPDKEASVKSGISYVNGNWGNVDKGSGDVPVLGSVVTTYIEQAKSDHYAYIVKPGASIDDVKKFTANIPVKVLANTADLQAIRVSGRTMAVFYTAHGKVNFRDDGQSVIASDPCILIFEPNGTIWISDPTHKLTETNVAVNKRLIQIKLPVGDLAGSSVKVDY